MLMVSRTSSVMEDVLALSQTIRLTKAVFLAYILPPVVCQYLMGVLVQLEGTRIYRMALLPVTACLAWRGTFVDVSGGDPMKAQMNTMLTTQMCVIVTRCAVWAFAQVRYKRHSPMNNLGRNDVFTACWNAWDLLCNQRGIGWNWSQGLFVPRPVFKTDSRVLFVLSTAVGVVYYAVGYDACAQAIHILSPETFGSVNGGSLFDHTLPPFLELLRAMTVSLLVAALAYFVMQYTYQLLAIVGVGLFHQHPSQWPPLFDAPWSSTSLSELWGRRWHQVMRDSVLSLGGRPFTPLFGRVGGLIAAFLISGVFHNLDLGRRGYMVTCLSFWLMNGIGVVLERLWKKTTGRKVEGFLGWMWTAAWLFLWGVPMVDAYARVGRFGALRVVGGLQPSLALVALVRRVFGHASS